MLSVTYAIYAECHYAECDYAECHYAVCNGAFTARFKNDFVSSSPRDTFAIYKITSIVIMLEVVSFATIYFFVTYELAE